MLALRLDCSTAALTTHQKVLPIWKVVELKMLDFSDRRRTGNAAPFSLKKKRTQSFPLNNVTNYQVCNESAEFFMSGMYFSSIEKLASSFPTKNVKDLKDQKSICNDLSQLKKTPMDGSL